MNTGWKCPNCGKAHAPHVETCPEQVTYAPYGPAEHDKTTTVTPYHPLPFDWPPYVPPYPGRFYTTCGSVSTDNDDWPGTNAMNGGVQ